VEFPDRERANPFVARLWATQRVGYLSAERRKRGASAEVDTEIRQLGEQYGIPTELTSYLVREPQVAATGMPAAAPLPQRLFEAAKAASAMRASVSLASVDSVAPLDAAIESKKQVRQGERVFDWVARDSAWVDSRYRSDRPARVVAIAPYSAAYFAVLDAVPLLRPALALGDRVVVVGRGVVLRVTPAGAATVSDADFAALRAGW
jgi:hypothetical protein